MMIDVVVRLARPLAADGEAAHAAMTVTIGATVVATVALAPVHAPVPARQAPALIATVTEKRKRAALDSACVMC